MNPFQEFVEKWKPLLPAPLLFVIAFLVYLFFRGVWRELDEDALLARWQEVLGERLLVVPYEDLVEQPASWIHRILTHCGLPEEPGVFTAHKTERTVTTASVMQVRRPLNRDGLGASAPYGEMMQPFVDAYCG